MKQEKEKLEKKNKEKSDENDKMFDRIQELESELTGKRNELEKFKIEQEERKKMFGDYVRTIEEMISKSPEEEEEEEEEREQEEHFQEQEQEKEQKSVLPEESRSPVCLPEASDKLIEIFNKYEKRAMEAEKLKTQYERKLYPDLSLEELEKETYPLQPALYPLEEVLEFSSVGDVM